jgi:hypothetical protein
VEALGQSRAAGDRIPPHELEQLLQIRAVGTEGLRPEFARKIKARRIDAVHDGSVPRLIGVWFHIS